MKWSAFSEINCLAETLQHYLILCFYFSHASVARRNLRKEKKKKKKRTHNRFDRFLIGFDLCFLHR